MTAAITIEFAELAVDLLNEFIPEPNCIWYSISQHPTPIDQPYNAGISTQTPKDVRILFVRDDLEDRQLLRYNKNSVLIDGLVNGYMYYYDDFTPKLKDVVKWGDIDLTVSAIDVIQPIDLPLLYFIEFAS